MSTQREAEDLSLRTVAYVVAAGFAFRALLIPASLLAGWSYVSAHAAQVLLVAGAFTCINVFLAVKCLERAPVVLASRLYMTADIAAAIALNLWATHLLVGGVILSTGSDIFWQYELGTVFIWTAAHGLRLGSVLVAGAALLEASMIAENHAALTSAGLVQAGGRVGWIAAGCLVPWAIVASATRGSKIASTEAVALGRKTERTRVLADMHDGVLQTLGEVARRTVSCAARADAVLTAIAQLVNHQVETACQEFNESNAIEPTLGMSLEIVAADFRGRGLEVHVERDGAGREPTGTMRAALIGAAREALTNTLRHSQVTEAGITLLHGETSVTIEVVDHGGGFRLGESGHGLGIRNSILGRVHDAGGKATVVSAPGCGTTVTLVAPVKTRAKITTPGRSLTCPRSFDADDLEAEALGWLAVPALVYRVCLTPLQVALAYWTLRSDLTTVLWAGMSIIWVFDLSLLLLSLTSRCGQIFRSWLLVVVDVSLVVAINVVAASELPHGTALVPGHEFLWGYTFGLVLLWTAIRGLTGGLVMLGIGMALQAGISALNGVSWSEQAVLVLAAQLLKLSTALILAWLITRLARFGFQLAIEGSRRVGVEQARADNLRDLFDNAIARLREIADLCRQQAMSARERVRLVRGASLGSLSQLRHRLAVLTGKAGESPQELTGIINIVEQYQRTGLRVELVRGGELFQLPVSVMSFVAAELRKALDNVLEHSGAVHVVVHLDVRIGELELVIRDHGTGFSIGAGEGGPRRESLASDKTVASALVETWSEPGHGTRVVVSVEWRSQEVTAAR